VPAAIVYPTGGGTGLVGMWKAFDELEAAGWIDARRPRMYSVQAEGCAPIVRAFESGAEKAEPWVDAQTAAWGLRVPGALGDRLILRALRDSGGAALAVSEAAMSTACRAARSKASTRVKKAARRWPRSTRSRRATRFDDGPVVLFNTGSALKYAPR
jgi:threonine synthase